MYSCYWQWRVLLTRSLPLLNSASSSSVMSFDSKVLGYVEKLSKLLSDSGRLLVTSEKSRKSEILCLRDQIIEEQNVFGQLDRMGKETGDGDFLKIVEADKSECLRKIRDYEETLIQYIVGPDPTDSSPSVILEVNSGAGGQEAMLFTSDLLGMYNGFASFAGLNFSILQCQESPLGGIRYAVASVSGLNCYKRLKFEGGVHRVQRVPTTEKTGRMHTSTASVVVMPEPENVEIVLKSGDLEVDVMRSSGPGGQHVNKTDSAVRVKHLPSGLVVECQTSRSQTANRQEAIKRLSAILYQRQIDEVLLSKQSTRRLQVGSKSRSEKIRTYNFQQDRITDHRTKQTFAKVREVMKGQDAFNVVVNSLQKYNLEERLSEMCNEL